MVLEYLLSSLTASLQGPDGISAYHGMQVWALLATSRIQTSARTRTILPFPIRLFSQEVKVMACLYSCPLHQELCLRALGVSRLPMFEKDGKVGESL